MLYVSNIENLIEQKALNTGLEQRAMIFIKAINDWPDKVLSFEEYVTQVEAFINSTSTMQNLHKADFTRDAWKAESIAMIMDIYGFYDKELSLGEIVQDIDNRMIDLYCKLYVSTTIDRTKLADLIATFYKVKNDDRHLVVGNLEIYILKNKDYDPTKQSEFPDGFLFFPVLFELLFDDDAELNEAVYTVSGLLSYLWSEGMAAVVSCQYEHLLINKGGYKSPSVPWPVARV